MFLQKFFNEELWASFLLSFESAYHLVPIFVGFESSWQDSGESTIVDLVCPDFSESCGYLQYLSGDGVLYISLILLYLQNGTSGLYIRLAPARQQHI